MSKGLTKGMWQRTLQIAIFILVVLVAVDGGRLFYLQVIAADKYQEKAQSQQLKDTEIAASRGTIYDANMNVISKSATVWNVYINPKKITEKNRELVATGICSMFEYDETKKQELLANMEKSTAYVEIEKKIETPKKTEVAKFISDNKLGDVIGLTQSTKRYYPSNNFASTVVGFTGTDDQGLAGIEAKYNDVLTGVPGRIVTAKDARSNALPDEYESTYDAKNGGNLVLTIDQNIQYILEKGMEDTVKDFDAKGAYGIVMNPNTGAVLAMSTKPDFNLNSPWLIDYQKSATDVESILDSDAQKEARSLAVQRQWRNRVISDVYVPGSVFKAFMVSAALEESVVTPEFSYTCTGSIKVADRTMSCLNHSGHGTQTLVQGLANSCNPFFVTVGQRLGAEKFYKYYEGFGFTEKTGIDLPGEASPIYKKQSELGPVELASASFGQTNSITPIQVCTGLSAIANGGKLMKPYIVSEIIDEDGNSVSKTEPVTKRQVISEETSKTVLSMMENVVEKGTGKNGYVAGYHVGGKTGTSTKLGESADGEKKKYLASFGAIAPVDDPQIVVLIIIDEPNQDLGGGALAAPIAATIIEQALKHMNVEPKYTPEELAKLNIKTPNVTGISVAKAKEVLTNNGFKCKVEGSGENVLKQSPTADTTIPTGGTIVLYTSDGTQSNQATVPDLMGMTVSQANAAAAAAGINIALSGGSLTSSDVVSYKQSEVAGTNVETGAIITVYFKHTTGVRDSVDNVE